MHRDTHYGKYACGASLVLQAKPGEQTGQHWSDHSLPSKKVHWHCSPNSKSRPGGSAEMHVELACYCSPNPENRPASSGGITLFQAKVIKAGIHLVAHSQPRRCREQNSFGCFQPWGFGSTRCVLFLHLAMWARKCRGPRRRQPSRRTIVSLVESKSLVLLPKLSSPSLEM